MFSLQDSMELVHKQSKAVAVTCMSFPIGDVNNFVVGSEEGSVYTACRHGRWIKAFNYSKEIKAVKWWDHVCFTPLKLFLAHI